MDTMKRARAARACSAGLRQQACSARLSISNLIEDNLAVIEVSCRVLDSTAIRHECIEMLDVEWARKAAQRLPS